MKPVDVLMKLLQGSNIDVRSTPELVGNVDKAIAKDNKKRKEGEGGEGEPLRRKPRLDPIPAAEYKNFQLTFWDVLHTLGEGLALSRRGAARGLAEHWGSLKYAQALTESENFMRLSDEGKEPAGDYKRLQSKELGDSFALALAKQILSQRYPQHLVSIVHADTALRAGWEKLGHYRPQFFAEVWKPGGASRVFPIACKGTHGKASSSYTQLASASAYAEAVHIGSQDKTPSLVFSTELSADRPLAIHALHFDGNGGLLGRLTGSQCGNLNDAVKEENFPPGILLPVKGDEISSPELVSGFHIKPERFEWFQCVLARTAAAGVAAFTGDGMATAQYLTKRQGEKRFSEYMHPTMGNVQDVHYELLGRHFVGTDHVFRLNKLRIEAFSGVEKKLFQYLKDGNLEQYRREIYARRTDRSSRCAKDKKWSVSMHSDGSVLAMRTFPV